MFLVWGLVGIKMRGEIVLAEERCEAVAGKTFDDLVGRPRLAEWDGLMELLGGNLMLLVRIGVRQSL